MSRKLAHIEKIEWIAPIKGKDRIVLAGILGWQVIVQKDIFNVGDLVVFCEIDSVMPQKPEFEFLASKNYRIKTMKMAGVLSQGICFPMTILPKGNYSIGQDVTNILGITQFDQTMDKEKKFTEKKKYNLLTKLYFKLFKKKIENKKAFPSFVSKTDEVRIQNVPFLLQTNKNWIATEKIDGQSGTFVLKRIRKKSFLRKEKFDFIVCSRNLRIYNEDNSSYWQVANKYKIKDVLTDLIKDNEYIAIQGECIASNVQGNKYKVKEPDLYVFNLIYPKGRVDSLTAKSILTQEKYGLKFVPIIETNVNLKEKTVNDVLEYATGKSQLYDTLREGIVFRSKDGLLSFKAISPEFLLKHNE